MTKDKLYTILKHIKYKLTRQQYLTIKGQINTNNLIGAYKGIKRVINNETN